MSRHLQTCYMTKTCFMRLAEHQPRMLIGRTSDANGEQLSVNSDSSLAISPRGIATGLTKGWSL